ncbi:MAG: hypothetical protein S0880_36795 [Actinomycetota bacterium]|nr:hypothetical protein [Actinomycetota bacterium]
MDRLIAHLRETADERGLMLATSIRARLAGDDRSEVEDFVGMVQSRGDGPDALDRMSARLSGAARNGGVYRFCG